MTERTYTKGGKLMSRKDQIIQIIEDLPENELDKLFKFLHDNYEIVASKEDIEAILRGKKEIENGEYREL